MIRKKNKFGRGRVEGVNKYSEGKLAPGLPPKYLQLPSSPDVSTIIRIPNAKPVPFLDTYPQIFAIMEREKQLFNKKHITDKEGGVYLSNSGAAMETYALPNRVIPIRLQTAPNQLSRIYYENKLNNMKEF
jgi:hypothetical protein